MKSREWLSQKRDRVLSLERELAAGVPGRPRLERAYLRVAMLDLRRAARMLDELIESLEGRAKNGNPECL